MPKRLYFERSRYRRVLADLKAASRCLQPDFFDLMILRFTTDLCSLPIITIGASSTALYCGDRQGERSERLYQYRKFSVSFRQIWCRSMVLWLIILAVSVLLRLNIRDFDGENKRAVRLFYLPVCGSAIYYQNGNLLSLSALSIDMPTGWL